MPVHDLLDGSNGKMKNLKDLFPYGGEQEIGYLRDPHGVWEYDRGYGMIRRRKVHGKDTIGDIRISY